LNPLQQFVAELLEQEGAVVEPIEPEGLEVLAPAPLQQALRLSELARLGFGAELPVGAQRVSLESDWMERLAGLLEERGRRLEWIVAVDNPVPGSPERILQHGLELLNATYRLQGVEPAWTRYLILRFRYAAVSDEKRDGILELGFNLANGATLDELLTGLVAGAMELEPLAAAPTGIDLPPTWPLQRLQPILERVLAPRVGRQLEPFLKGMRRRQERDLQRLHDYHNDLRREALERLAVLPSGELNEKQQLERQRQQLRLTAIAREYEAKVNDLRQKYAMKVTLEWVQTLELIMPVHRFAVLIKRRKGERLLTLDWNPLARRLEQAPCEYSYTWERPREVCDEALHLLSRAAHGPCPQCGRAYCRVCHPGKCPKCGRTTDLGSALMPLGSQQTSDGTAP
jgi:predicted RNA-binding Zn-ribbon protein involved in translation (DUF1610 family)